MRGGGGGLGGGGVSTLGDLFPGSSMGGKVTPGQTVQQQRFLLRWAIHEHISVRVSLGLFAAR